LLFFYLNLAFKIKATKVVSS